MMEERAWLDMGRAWLQHDSMAGVGVTPDDWDEPAGDDTERDEGEQPMTHETPRTAAAIADLLNAYEAEHTDPRESNLWGDVIHGLPEYDEMATADEDPGARSDVVVLRDGSVVRYRAEQKAWAADA